MNTYLFKILAVLVSLSLVLAACGAPAGGNIVRSEQRRELQPPTKDVDKLVAGNNAFAWDLYRELSSQPGNLVYSPFSISLALAMTYAGAAGETETQMRDALHFELDQEQLHPAFNALDLALEKSVEPENKDEQPLLLRIANAVWAEQTFSFRPTFLDTLAVDYGAGLQPADFKNNYEAVRKDVNRWVEDQTEDKIKDLIAPGVFNPDTRMALVNAIYFKADWLSQFDPNDTTDMPFHMLDGSQPNVPMMMNDNMYLPYASGDGWQMVELPYAGGTAAMNVIVPDEGQFEAVQGSLDAGSLEQMIAGMEQSDLVLGLPKFKFESSFGLADPLRALGMSDAFDRNTADFSGMTGARDLFISAVVHKAFVAVDEKGTEAAAATAAVMELTMAMQPGGTRLIIDRPFIFVIRDLQSGQILFVGRVLNPQA